jgi:translation initiation factor 1 (eIF-1/SUI1)
MDPFDNNHEETPFDTTQENNQTLFSNEIIIWIETHGKKKNTFIKGLQFDESALKDHLKNIKKKHGCNGSMKDNILQFQGDHINNIKVYFNSIGISNIVINSSHSE